MKAAATVKDSLTPQKPSVEGMVDELGEIQRVLAPFRTSIARETALKNGIREAHADTAAAAEISIEGTKFRAFLSARGNESVIDIVRLAKAIKPSEFIKFATCTLKALTKRMSRRLSRLPLSPSSRSGRGR